MEKKEAINLQSERDEAFSELDLDKIKKYYASQGMPPFSSEKVLWAGVHKARLYLSCIDDEGRELSRKWLIDNGFTPGVSSPALGSEKSNILRGIFGKKK